MDSERTYTTGPHAAQQVILVEDDQNFENRIYVIRDAIGDDFEVRTEPPSSNGVRSVGILGSELDNLCRWWSKEKERRGINEETDDQ